MFSFCCFGGISREAIEKTYKVPEVPFQIIKTSTDVSRFQLRKFQEKNCNIPFKFAFLGGVQFPYRPDLAMRLVSKLSESGINCKIDFINERDHQLIESTRAALKISENKVSYFSCNHSDIPKLLSSYSCGIIAIETSPWRRVCSPTKLGEYLAAGLPVLALKGIDVTDKFASSSACVEIFTETEVTNGLDSKKLNLIHSLLLDQRISAAAKTLAHNEFSLEMAGKQYLQLYKEIFV